MAGISLLARALCCGAVLAFGGPVAIGAELIAGPPLAQAEAATETVLMATLGEAKHDLTLADLAKLPGYGADLETIWNMNGRWTGVRLSDLLTHLGFDPAAGARLRAIDDYEITLDRALIDKEQPLLAYAVDGQLLPPDNMGPLMLVWPSRAEGALAGTEVLTNWIWSIDRLDMVR